MRDRKGVHVCQGSVKERQTRYKKKHLIRKKKGNDTAVGRVPSRRKKERRAFGKEKRADSAEAERTDSYFRTGRIELQ